MPIIPTYQSNIGAPDLSGAWLGGQRIAQEDAADAARISLGYEQIAANRVENEMRLAAQKEALSRQALKTAQEQEIEKAYRETQLGLAERRLKDDEAITRMRLAETARNFSTQQEYMRRVSAGEDPELVWRSIGVGLPGFSAALERPSAAAERKYPVVAGQDLLGKPTRVPMTASEFGSWLPTAPPELRTNTVNTAIEQMLRPQLTPPAGVTNIQRSIRVVRDKDGKLVIQR